MNMDLTGLWALVSWPVALIVLALAGLALKELIGLLASKNKDQGFATWYRIAYMLVQAAEQALSGDTGAAKFDWVRNALSVYFPALTTEQIQQLIEAAVLEMHNALKSLPAPATATPLEIVPSALGGQLHS